MGRLNELQNFTEELQRNVSLQLVHNMDSSKKIRDLSVTLQKIAIKLCHELYSKEPGNPIPLLSYLLDHELSLRVT